MLILLVVITFNAVLLRRCMALLRTLADLLLILITHVGFCLGSGPAISIGARAAG